MDNNNPLYSSTWFVIAVPIKDFVELLHTVICKYTIVDANVRLYLQMLFLTFVPFLLTVKTGIALFCNYTTGKRFISERVGRGNYLH